MAERSSSARRATWGPEKVVVGTKAAVEQGLTGTIGSARLRITETRQGTELHVGEAYDVPKADLESFWKTT